MGECAICERDVETTRHHLTPQNRKESSVVPVCDPCHRQIHAVFTNHELRHRFNTVADLKESEEMRKFAAWIRKTNKTAVQVDETEHVSDWRG
jgi:5-methylcytosine-specific restriction protein A